MLRSSSHDPLVQALDQQDHAEVRRRDQLRSARRARNMQVSRENLALAETRKILQKAHLENVRPATAIHQTKTGGILHKRRNSVDIKRANTKVFDAELKRQIDSRMSERVSREKQQQERERR